MQDVIPFLVRHQRTAPPLPLARADSAALVQSALVGGGAAGLPDYATSLSHGGGGGGGGPRSASAYPGASPPLSRLEPRVVAEYSMYTSTMLNAIVRLHNF